MSQIILYCINNSCGVCLIDWNVNIQLQNCVGLSRRNDVNYLSILKFMIWIVMPDKHR